jgi:membrane protease subunit HflC
VKIKVLGILLVVALVAVYVSCYVVDETEQVVITQFGRPVGGPKTEPGIYFKIPYPIQEVNRFAKNLLEWDGDPGQVPTLDKTFIWVDTFARWKIVDPLRFFEKVRDETIAKARLDTIINSAVRNLITSYNLLETVRMTNRELDTFEVGIDEGEAKEKSRLGEVKVGRQKIARDIMGQAQPKLEEMGMQLVDVKIKRLKYVEEVQRSVYDRMIAERNKIAEKFRSEGKGEARKIEGDMEKELKKITSEAYKTAQEIKGRADAKATRIYAEAFSKDPEFYSFLQTLEIYKEAMDKESSLVLSTDSEFLKYFKGYQRHE